MSVPEEYARPDLLAEPNWLWAQRGHPTLRIIDCGSAKGYARAHIPGAVHLLPAGSEALVAEGAWLKDLADPVHVIGPAAMAGLMEQLGISDETTVIAYDDYNGTYATRLWWVLAYYGHTNARVLNGGWQRWLDEGRPATFRATVPEPATFTPRVDESRRVRLAELLARHADPGVQVVNVLWPSWYTGEENPVGNRRVGHLPGSVNLPVECFFVDEAVPTFKTSTELRQVVEEAGLLPDRETIVHCQAGIRTTMGVFALSLLGWDQIRAYDAAMAEWANRDDTPLTTG
jgi:thiosulfate/3-mercaptopyruvate sulfurtransferase